MKIRINVDSRENMNKHIVKAFNKHKIDYKVQKIDEGDYSISIPEIDYTSNTVIERKASLEELSANQCGPKDENGHSRFQRELIRAQEKGLKVILLIENPNWYSDLLNHNYRTRLNPKAYRGLLFSLREKYGLEIVGVPKEYVGSYIYNVLYYSLKNELKEKEMVLWV